MFNFLKPLSKQQRKRKWHLYRSKNEARRKQLIKICENANDRFWHKIIRNAKRENIHNVTLWDKNGEQKAKCYCRAINPPKQLCFTKNKHETYRFFSTLRRNLDKSIKSQISPYKKLKNGEIAIASYYDYSKIEYISNACAVILATEYQRAAHYLGMVPPTVNLPDWNQDVFTALFEIGFFEIVGLSENNYSLFNENHNSHTKTLRIICAKNNDELDKIDKSLQELCNYCNTTGTPDASAQLTSFLSAISEALTNVVQHAYPESLTLPPYTFKYCWVSASANKTSRLLNIAVYDHGVSIPVTYPKGEGMLTNIKSYIIKLNKKMKSTSDTKRLDGPYIQAAMKFGASQTKLPYRGQGLPQMYEPLKRSGNGTLSVYSRYGWCVRRSDYDLVNGTEKYPLTGTLIEWSVKF